MSTSIATTRIGYTPGGQAGQKAGSGNNGTLRALTGIRGIAAWWVVLFHFKAYLPAATPNGIRLFVGNGYLAVDFFFVLSGFIIAHNYLRVFQEIRFGRCLHFLGLRLARVYPLHLFMLLCFLINPLAIALAASLPPDPTRYDPIYYCLSLLLVQNWGFTSHLAWNVPAWSISTELFAYLLFPFVAWLTNRWARTLPRAIFGVLISLTSLALCLYAIGETLAGDIPRYGLIRCVLEFVAGVCLWRVWATASVKPVSGLVARLIFVCCLTMYLLLDLPDLVVIPLACCCLVFVLAMGSGTLPRILSNRAVEIVGLCSYSTYLSHYLVRDWVKFLLVKQSIPSITYLFVYIGGTAVASALLYRMIEIPGRRTLRAFVDHVTISVTRPAA